MIRKNSGRHMKAGIWCLAATLALPPLSGCSRQLVQQTGYETLHNVSDRENERDPNYDPGPRPSYDLYRQRREEILREQRPPVAAPTPLVPAAGP